MACLVLIRHFAFSFKSSQELWLTSMCADIDNFQLASTKTEKDVSLAARAQCSHWKSFVEKMRQAALRVVKNQPQPGDRRYVIEKGELLGFFIYDQASH